MSEHNLANRIKQLRQKQGFSQEQLAEEAGVSLRTVQRIENGETQSTGTTLKLLAAALNVSAEELLDWGQKEDINYLVMTQLTALTFLFFPLLSILLPVIMWVSKKDQVKGLNQVAGSLINFQITWNLIVFFFPLVVIFPMMLTGKGLSISILVFLFGLFIVVLYVLNLIQILKNIAKVKKEHPVRYQPAIQFIKV